MLVPEEVQELIKKGDCERAILLCQDAVEKEHGRSDLYLLLGRSLLAADRKKEAIRAFRDGLLYDGNPKIRDELERLGLRSPPVIPSLGRSHWMNRFLGKSLKALRLRS